MLQLELKIEIQKLSNRQVFSLILAPSWDRLVITFNGQPDNITAVTDYINGRFGRLNNISQKRVMGCWQVIYSR